MSYQTTPDGCDRQNVTRLIGVELTYIATNGDTEEIAMLVPPGGHFDLPGRGDVYAGYGRQLQVTLHTSDGDRAARIQL